MKQNETKDYSKLNNRIRKGLIIFLSVFGSLAALAVYYNGRIWYEAKSPVEFEKIWKEIISILALVLSILAVYLFSLLGRKKKEKEITGAVKLIKQGEKFSVYELAKKTFAKKAFESISKDLNSISFDSLAEIQGFCRKNTNSIRYCSVAFLMKNDGEVMLVVAQLRKGREIPDFYLEDDCLQVQWNPSAQKKLIVKNA